MSDTVINPEIKSEIIAAWEKLRRGQTWAGNAPLPLMLNLARTSKFVTQSFEETMGLSFPQIRILFGASIPGGVSQAALCKQFKIDPGAITRTVQAMERDSLVTRNPGTKDARLMVVNITEKGQALVDELPARIAAFEREMVEGLTDEEIQTTHRVLDKLFTKYTARYL